MDFGGKEKLLAVYFNFKFSFLLLLSNAVLVFSLIKLTISSNWPKGHSNDFEW